MKNTPPGISQLNFVLFQSLESSLQTLPPPPMRYAYRYPIIADTC